MFGLVLSNMFSLVLYPFQTYEYLLKRMFGPSEHWVVWYLCSACRSKTDQAAPPKVLVQQKFAHLFRKQCVRLLTHEKIQKLLWINSQIQYFELILSKNHMHSLWTSRIGTNCTISLVATRSVELSNLRPLSASRICQQSYQHQESATKVG